MIEFRLDAREVIEDYQKKARKFPRAVTSSIRKVSTQTRNYIAKEITQKYNIKSSDLKKSFYVKRTMGTRTRGYGNELTAVSKGISFTRFGTKFPTKQTKGPSGKKRFVVKTKIKKGTGLKVARNVFMIPGKKTFFRSAGGRKVEKAYAIGPAQMFNEDMMNRAVVFIFQKWPIIVEHEIDFFYK